MLSAETVTGVISSNEEGKVASATNVRSHFVLQTVGKM